MKTDVLIIGAGASGLMAARELGKEGKKVMLIDARPYTGGRIHTFHKPGFGAPVEAGAEFIHGKQHYTLQLLKEFGIKYRNVNGEIWQVKNGIFKKEKEFIEDHHNEFIRALKKQEEDLSVEEFLDTNFGNEKYSALRNSIRKYNEGYAAAELSRASILALKEDWLEGDDDQYRIEGGYDCLTEALAEECKKTGAVTLLSTVITKIEWERNNVTAISENRKKYSAPVAIVTLPPSLLAESAQRKGNISFMPEIPAKREAAKNLGFGGVIKFILQFNNAFWKDKPAEKIAGKDLENLSFIFSDATIPTWWTQHPDDVPILTGWLGGPAAANYLTAREQELLNIALTSLASIFSMPLNVLENNLKTYHITNWQTDAFSRGAYSYDVVNGKIWKEELITPLEDTLYFAGEALSMSELAGTVEAALASGMEVSKKILKKEKVSLEEG
ncbi:MAG: NAD(P)/FAD-dependent oxidoreductase [Bacteroidia bacterium]